MREIGSDPKSRLTAHADGDMPEKRNGGSFLFPPSLSLRIAASHQSVMGLGADILREDPEGLENAAVSTDRRNKLSESLSRCFEV